MTITFLFHCEHCPEPAAPHPVVAITTDAFFYRLSTTPGGGGAPRVETVRVFRNGAYPNLADASWLTDEGWSYLVTATYDAGAPSPTHAHALILERCGLLLDLG